MPRSRTSDLIGNNILVLILLSPDLMNQECLGRVPAWVRQHLPSPAA